MKIDIFPHILPSKYREFIEKKFPSAVLKPIQAINGPFPAMVDLDKRFAIMDKYDDYVQILNIPVRFSRGSTESKVTEELIRLGNDELAGLVAKYPCRFVAAIGNLPMSNINDAMKELDRTIKDLHFKGIQINTDIDGKALDAPEFMPLYEKMQEYDLPILLHPARPPSIPDYSSESSSKYKIHQIFGWPYDTSATMVRLVLSHVLEKYRNIKFVTHHCGGMIPFFDKRLLSFLSGHDMDAYTGGLSKAPLEYFKLFYADTALQGSTPGLMCGYKFFGANRIVFGTDMPYGSHGDSEVINETIGSIEKMNIPHKDKVTIFEKNAKKLFHLTL